MKTIIEISSEKLNRNIPLIRRYFNEKRSTSRGELIAMAIAEIAGMQARQELIEEHQLSFSTIENYLKSKIEIQPNPKTEKLISRDPGDAERELEALD